MNFFILVDSGNPANLTSLELQSVPGDVISINNLHTYPSRTIHRSIIHTRAKSCNKLMIIGRNAIVPHDLLQGLRSYGNGYNALAIDDSRAFSFASHHFVKTPNFAMKNCDIIVINKDIYRGRLADMSNHLSYTDIIKVLLQPVSHEIYLAKFIDESHEDPNLEYVPKILEVMPPPPEPLPIDILAEPPDEQPKVDLSFSPNHRDKYDANSVVHQTINKINDFSSIGIHEVMIEEEQIYG